MGFKQGQSVRVGQLYGHFNFYSGQGAAQVTLEDDRQITFPISQIAPVSPEPKKYPVTPAKFKPNHCADCQTPISYLAARCPRCHGKRVGSANASKNKTRGFDLKLRP